MDVTSFPHIFTVIHEMPLGFVLEGHRLEDRLSRHLHWQAVVQGQVWVCLCFFQLKMNTAAEPIRIQLEPSIAVLPFLPC